LSRTTTIGTRIGFDGRLWEVAEMTGAGVVLRDALGGLRQASISHLLADPGTRLTDAAPVQAALAAPGTSGLAMADGGAAEPGRPRAGGAEITERYPDASQDCSLSR
jgi:hypothetical protein